MPRDSTNSDDDNGISPDFPAKLRRARKMRGLTQGQLSKRIGADVQRISRYERGVLVPTTKLIVRLAEALDVNLDYLLRDGEEHAAGAIRDPELLERFTQVDSLPDKDKEILKALLEAFIKKHRFEQLARE